jgi:hypothetical protein
MDKSLRVIFILLVITLVLDTYGLYRVAYDLTNFVSFNISVLFETSFLLFFFIQVFPLRFAKKAITVVLFLLLAFWLNHFIKRGERLFLFNCVILENTVVIILSLCYYYQQFVKLNISYTYLGRQFWTISSFFVYVSATFVLFLYIPSVSSPEFMKKYYNVNSVFIILRSILLTITFSMDSNNPPKNNRFNLT